MSRGKKLQEMEVDVKESNAVTAGANSGDKAMPKAASNAAGVSTPGNDGSWEDLGGPTPENYKTDDESAKLKTPGASLAQVKNVVNKGAKPGDQTAGKLKKEESEPEGEVVAEEEVSTEEHKVAPPTIYMWAKRDKWGEQKAVAIADTQRNLAESEGQRFARLQAEQLDAYTQIANKAGNEIQGLTFDRPLDAARAADIGIKGQREVLQGMINMEFVQDIMTVLIEEVTDQDTLQRIGVKLKAIEQKHREI